MLANALNLPITVMETAGEGGPWGMAVLAWYALRTQTGTGEQQGLADFLDDEVFCGAEGTTLLPEPAGALGAEAYIERYRAALPAEQRAAETLVDQEEA